MTEKAVLVTTEHGGVFFGYLRNDRDLPNSVTLGKVRNCIYWSADIGGFLGLAQIGPSSKCKIGIQAEEITLYHITSIAPVSEPAEKLWNSSKLNLHETE